MTTLRAKTNNFLLKHRKADINIYAILILPPDADVAIVIRHQVEVKHVIKPLSAVDVKSCTFLCQLCQLHFHHALQRDVFCWWQWKGVRKPNQRLESQKGSSNS